MEIPLSIIVHDLMKFVKNHFFIKGEKSPKATRIGNRVSDICWL